MADIDLEPKFSRSDLAKILNCSTLTIANREKRNIYPQPRRDLNNYRYYTLSDIFYIQEITLGGVDHRPILSILYDKGYRDPKELPSMMDKILARYRRGIYTDA